MFVIYELEIGQRELLFQKFCQLFLDGLSPMSHQDDKFVNCPRYATTRNLKIVAFEFGF